MRRVLILLVAAAALAAAAPAGAHPKPASWAGPISLHKICVAVGACHDVKPRVSNAGFPPEEDCNFLKIGRKVKVWDPKLGAYVIWVCNCNWDTGICRWWYLKKVHVKTVPWNTKNRSNVLDYQRACKSIVCKKVGVWHYYRVKFVRPTR